MLQAKTTKKYIHTYIYYNVLVIYTVYCNLDCAHLAFTFDIWHIFSQNQQIISS